jgi:excisionase family DNA binding protein
MSHEDLAAERAELEAAGKNWEARHVADLIGLSELTVKRMARKGTLPAVKVGRKWEFPPAKIRAWYGGDPWEMPPRPRPRGPGKPK